MKIIKIFKNNELLTFTEDNKIKIYIDDNYQKLNIKKGYKINLIGSNQGSYKGSFMNNYICKKFISNQKVNPINIETNKILNYCKYFLLSENEYINYFPENVKYDYYWFLRSPSNDPSLITVSFRCVITDSDAIIDDNIINNINPFLSGGFIPFFFTRKKVKK